MAKLTTESGETLNVRNVALFARDVDVTFDGGPGGIGRPGSRGEPDRCEYTLSRRHSSRLRYMARGEMELPGAEVLELTGFEVIRDSRGSPDVRVRSRVERMAR